MTQTLPPGWTTPFEDSDPCYLKGPEDLEVSLDEESLQVSWREGCDDHYGTTTRSTSIPTSVLRALLARLEGTRGPS